MTVMAHYRNLLEEARDRSRHWGVFSKLDDELLGLYLAHGQPAGVSLTREQLVEFSRTAWMPMVDRAGACLQVHVSVIEHLMKAGFPSPPVLTIGDVTIAGRRRYNVTRQGLRSLVRAGRTGKSTIHVHAWLTFPDMTILDMSLMPALAYERGEPLTRDHPDGLAVVGYPDVLEYQYEPMLIGMEFVWHVAAMVPEEKRVSSIARRWAEAGGLNCLRERYEPGWVEPSR